LLICDWHHHRGVGDLEQLPALDVDLGLALVPMTSGVKARTSVSRSPGLSLDQGAFEARDWLRSGLGNLAGYVVTERGLKHSPGGTVQELSGFLTRHATWMSANRVLAPIWTRQVANLRAEARKQAYRSRRTSMKLGDCPLTKDDGSVCGTPVRHDPSDYAGQRVVCSGCGTVGTVDWWQSTIFADQDTKLPDVAVARLLSTRYGRLVAPSTIRSWAARGLISAQKSAEGRTVFDLAQVRAHADTVWTPVAVAKTV
jgi:hypothetical protein